MSNTQMTVKELAALCLQEVEKGNGDKKIVISDDNEGNGYHGLFYGFTAFEESEQEYLGSMIYDTQEKDCKKTIMLG